MKLKQNIDFHSILIGQDKLFVLFESIDEFKKFSKFGIFLLDDKFKFLKKVYEFLEEYLLKMIEFRIITRYSIENNFKVSIVIYNYFLGLTLIFSLILDIIFLLSFLNFSIIYLVLSLFSGMFLSLIITYVSIKSTCYDIQASIERDLLDFINEMTLHICSGVSITNSIFEAKGEKKNSYFYFTLNMAMRLYFEGESIVLSMEKFRKNTNSILVDKFVQIIINASNSGDLKIRLKLSELKDSIWDSRFRNIKEEAEKIKTKMIIPLMLNFIGIMLMLIVPIMINMGGVFYQ